MKKTKLRIVSAVLVLVMSMSSISFAAVSESIAKENSASNSAAASATLIRLGGNYQLWDGVPSSFGNLTWSQWATHSSSMDAATPLSVVAGTASLIKGGAGGIWSLIGASLLTNDINNVMGEAFFQNVVSNATVLPGGTKTAYARVYESHAQSYSGTLQYSRVYVTYYTNSSYSTSCGTTNTLCLYAWPDRKSVV